MLSQYVIGELNRVIHNDPLLHVHGPLSLEVDGPAFLAPIQKFRYEQYQQSSAYLNAYFQESLERKLLLDERGLHFYASYNGQVIASLRVTPPPFEMSGLSNELRDRVEELKDYVELGRLLVDDRFRSKGVGKKLLYASAIHLVNQRYQGFIAICREHRRREFLRFGLVQNGPPFEIKTRPGSQYYLLSGNWDRFIRGVLRYYGKRKFLSVFKKGSVPYLQFDKGDKNANQ